ncbi:MAG: rhodanese-like domain-containing protein [Cyclobacteriaceae bacterium]|nr:rhodanese-like domain-containing protein [Cyclobacteriaceae bacterium]
MKKSNFNICCIVLAMMLPSPWLMAQVSQTPKSAKELVTEAKKEIENLTPQQVQDELAKGNVVLIDIRESEELKQSGKIEGAIHAPRGMLEFYADPATPYFKPEFDKNKRIILQCASGGRSALAVVTLKEMGFTNVAHLDGGLKAWKDSGKPVVK